MDSRNPRFQKLTAVAADLKTGDVTAQFESEDGQRFSAVLAKSMIPNLIMALSAGTPSELGARSSTGQAVRPIGIRNFFTQDGEPGIALILPGTGLYVPVVLGQEGLRALKTAVAELDRLAPMQAPQGKPPN